MRKTKIICTLGPSTDQEGVLRELVANGMNVARFNFSHGSHEEHLGRFEKLKAIREELGKPVAALLDTKGPEIRLKDFKNGTEMLEAGQTFTLTTREVEGTKEICSITYKDLPQDVQPGGTIMLSSIWVAVTMGLPKEKERSMMFFWMPGSSVKSISTPRSPRATMTASAAARMLSMLFTPSRFSILAMMRM